MLYFSKNRHWRRFQQLTLSLKITLWCPQLTYLKAMKSIGKWPLLPITCWYSKHNQQMLTLLFIEPKWCQSGRSAKTKQTSNVLISHQRVTSNIQSSPWWDKNSIPFYTSDFKSYMIRLTTFSCAQKLTGSQLHLPQGTKKRESNEKN